MLTRLYIDNFRCFVGFEYRPGRTNLILGRNGSGKSSMLDALLAMRQFVTVGRTAEDLFPLNQRTR
jgi:AAA15 family ATPase/GTPase